MNAMFEWMYTSSIPQYVGFKEFRCLYLLAIKFEVNGLLSKLMEHIQEVYKDAEVMLKAKDLSNAYRYRTVGDGQLWEFCAKHVIGCLVQGKVTELWIKRFKRLCIKVPSLQNALFRTVLKSAEANLLRVEKSKKSTLAGGNPKVKLSKRNEKTEKVDESRKRGKRDAASRRSVNKKSKHPQVGTALEVNKKARSMS